MAVVTLTHLTVEHVIEPLGLATRRPRFGWVLDAAGRAGYANRHTRSRSTATGGYLQPVLMSGPGPRAPLGWSGIAVIAAISLHSGVQPVRAG